jgi:ubiquinone/menaquinone biosynthesis C-methylase UbiE
MFQHYEYSIYGGHNNLDITNINHPDGAFNWIICNHVLEHIENDYAAVSELIRITAINGVIQLNVPGPTGLQYTNDWGFPDPKIHDHYREYGILDFIDRFASIIKSKSYHSMKLHCKDPVTGSNDIVFFLSSSKENLEYISSKCQ